MAYWEDKSSSPSHLRFFDPISGWRAHDDVFDDQKRIIDHGSHLQIELALHTALNATNLILLTGAGSSFCAVNGKGEKSAPSMADLWDAVQTAVGRERFEKAIALIPNASNLAKNIEKLLTMCKLYSALFNDENSKTIEQFVGDAEKAIVSKVDFVIEKTDLASHRTLIRKLARRNVRKSRAKVFTTNYDLCFETAAQQLRFVTVDGFSHSSPQTYDRAHFTYDIVRRGVDNDPPDYVENVFQLYKLHGSIDWRRKGSTILRTRDEKVGEPVLIYPRDSKFQEAFASPYLDMMGAFQLALRQPDTALVISGFGFNDDHLTKPILAALEANITLRVILCDIAFLGDATLDEKPPPHVAPVNSEMRVKGNPCFDRLLSLAKIGDQRITLLNGRFEDLAQALPDLVAQTERERHLDRMKRLEDLHSGAAELGES